MDKVRETAAIILISVVLAGCTQKQHDGPFLVDCNCSLVQLIANPKAYDQKRVRIIGVAIAADAQVGVGRVYLTADDARFVNDSNSVWVEIRDQETPVSYAFEDLTGKFIVVEGLFLYRDGMLVITNVYAVRILSPLPLDNTRFERGI